MLKSESLRTLDIVRVAQEIGPYSEPANIFRKAFTAL